MPDNITYKEFKERLQNVDTPDSELAPYLVIDPERSTPLNPVLIPNPDLVEMSEEEQDLESAMGIANGMSRWRRQWRFKRSYRNGDRPVLVSEGDSWFQFPVLIDDVIDHLGRDYYVFSLGAAGDTANNMVVQAPEYLRALRWLKDHVKAFLFSGAGNDIIGVDPVTQQSVLYGLLKQGVQSANAADHINQAALSRAFAGLRGAYAQLIQTIRAEPGFATLPIIFHGYDHAIPNLLGTPEPRDPKHVSIDQFLGDALSRRGIQEDELRRDIIRFLIDSLYDLLNDLAADDDHIHVVDVRGTLPTAEDWADEIHGTSTGFRRVAAKFEGLLRRVGA
jgi:N-acetylmuramoyl-L-alanine amidase